MVSDRATQDAAFDAGAHLHRVARWLGASAVIGYGVCLALAVWLGFVSDVNDTVSHGKGAALETLFWSIPQLAFAPGPDDANVAVLGARVYVSLAGVAIVAAAVAGVVWLRADRLRKPLNPAPAGKHKRRR